MAPLMASESRHSGRTRQGAMGATWLGSSSPSRDEGEHAVVAEVEALRFDDAPLLALQQRVVLEHVREHVVQIGGEPMLLCLAEWREQPQGADAGLPRVEIAPRPVRAEAKTVPFETPSQSADASPPRDISPNDGQQLWRQRTGCAWPCAPRRRTARRVDRGTARAVRPGALLAQPNGAPGRCAAVRDPDQSPARRTRTKATARPYAHRTNLPRSGAEITADVVVGWSPRRRACRRNLSSPSPAVRTNGRSEHHDQSLDDLFADEPSS